MLGDISGFGPSLSEAARWCCAHARIDGPATSLRDPLADRDMFLERYLRVYQVVRERELALGENLAVWAPDDGRLLLYFPDENTSDGAAEASTHGFFDPHNTPPWDCWVGYYEDVDGASGSKQCYLAAWIPAVFVPLAEIGIEVTSDACLDWVENRETALREIWLSRRR